MGKILLAAAGIAALGLGAASLAAAQDGDHRGGRHGVFSADANSDGAVTRAEFDASRDARFTQQDANNDGQLTREEMREGWGERRRGRGHRGGGMHHLARADANEDGNITREEFLARPTQMFDRMDADNDGVISAAERPQRRERPDGAERRERPNFDSNGDGLISRSEHAAMGAGMFERLDANNDGSISQDEARARRGHRRGGE
jgi:Ca2+-binding EF-hand superfamily protein